MINEKKILDSIRPQINTIVKRILKEVIDFDEETPERDKVNGPDPSAMNPGEEVLVQAIKEYCNQTGKQMHFNDFQEILVGILRSFDTSDKIGKLKNMVSSIANNDAMLRFKKPEEPEMEEEPDMTDMTGDMGDMTDTGEEELSDEELSAVEDTEGPEGEIQPEEESDATEEKK